MMPAWKCRRCGRCCGIVPFEKEEMDALHTNVQFEPQIISGHTCYVPKAALATGRCPFYNRKRRVCEIYEQRPQVCRLFGEGPHPCLYCPFHPNYNPDAVAAVAQKVLKQSQQ